MECTTRNIAEGCGQEASECTTRNIAEGRGQEASLLVWCLAVHGATAWTAGHETSTRQSRML